jgi:VCBS repeat-containing protein
VLRAGVAVASGTTDGNGHYGPLIISAPGSYTISASRTGYATAAAVKAVGDGAQLTVNLRIRPL